MTKRDAHIPNRRPATSNSRALAKGLAVLAVMLIETTANSTEPCEDGLDLAHVLAAHGAAGMADVESLDFTFNAAVEGGDLARRWHWDRVRGEVSLVTPREDGSREMLAFPTPPPSDASQDVRDADRAFVNDVYWLLFPAQLAWETGVMVTVECTPQPLPFTGDARPRFTATYGAEGGYTPGDAYDFYVDSAGQITHWVFRRGGAEEPTFAVTFEEYAEVGPLRVATMHRGPGGTPRVWFTDVAATTGGEATPQTMPTQVSPE